MSMAEILILCHNISFYPSFLSPRFFEHQVSIVYNPYKCPNSIQAFLRFKITSSCTRSACGRRSPPWCSSERRRCCTHPRTPIVVFCILYSVMLYSLFSDRVHIHKATDLQFLTKCQLVVWRDENIITLQVGSDHYRVRATGISKHFWNDLIW